MPWAHSNSLCRRLVVRVFRRTVRITPGKSLACGIKMPRTCLWRSVEPGRRNAGVIAAGGRQIAESRQAIVFDTINASKVTGPSLVNSRGTVW